MHRICDVILFVNSRSFISTYEFIRYNGMHEGFIAPKNDDMNTVFC